VPKYQQRTQRESNNPPPRLARATPKIQNLMEMTPLVARTRALFVRAVRKGKRGLLHEECTSLQVIPQSPPLNAKKGCKWGAGQQPTAPKYIPSLTLPKKRDLHGPPENGTAKFKDSKSCGNNTYCCSDKGVVFANGREGDVRRCKASGLGNPRIMARDLEHRRSEPPLPCYKHGRGGGCCHVPLAVKF